VDWVFLEKVLRKMGFCEQWISWIMSCVKSVRFSVKVNGRTLEPFSPSRGLRQGDPLSPYLFLFVGETLSCILNKWTTEGRITLLKVARGASGISNLLFADDSLLFFKSTSEEARAVDNTLNLFQTLVEKSLLVAHHFGICVAHMGCATTATPLIIVYWWRIIC
jgi:hypothetical protein